MAADRLVSPRIVGCVFASLALVLFSGALGRVVQRPLWHDEIFTLYVANISAEQGLWHVLSTGVDLNPPVYYLAVRSVGAFVGAGAFATRLPSTLGFLTAMVALYFFARRRVEPVFALVAALALVLSGALMYSWEGRAYGFVLGASALALLAWQTRGAQRWRRRAPVLCATALAAAVSAHYYAGLIVLPLAAGEATRVLIHRRVDWGMWGGLLIGVGAPVLWLRGLVEAARQFGSTFWSPPTPGKLAFCYRELADPLALTLVLAAGCTIVASALWPDDATASVAVTPGSPITRKVLGPDEVVVLALVALPGAGYLLALYTGAFHGRYVLQGVLGLSLLVGWGCAVCVRTRTGAAILVSVLFLAASARLGSSVTGLFRAPDDPLAQHGPLLLQAVEGYPVVLSHAHDYLPIMHYADRALRARLVYVMQPPHPQLGFGTADRAMRLLADYAPLRVEEFDSFLRAHPRFYLYGRPSRLRSLFSRRGTVQFLGENDVGSLYVVHVTP